MNEIARVHEERGEDVSLAAVEGEIDASNADRIGTRLRRLLTNHSSALVLDLTSTTYLDSAGINLLFALAGELDRRQQRLHLVVPPSSHVARVLALVNVEEIVAVHATRDAAPQQTA